MWSYKISGLCLVVALALIVPASTVMAQFIPIKSKTVAGNAQLTNELSAQKRTVKRKTTVKRSTTVKTRKSVKTRRNVNVNVNRNTNVVVRRPYRGWVARPYYGTIIAGVALGTVIAASAIHTAPPPPAPNLCWFWSDPEEIHGYWDYCTPPR